MKLPFLKKTIACVPLKRDAFQSISSFSSGDIGTRSVCIFSIIWNTYVLFITFLLFLLCSAMLTHLQLEGS